MWISVTFRLVLLQLPAILVVSACSVDLSGSTGGATPIQKKIVPLDPYHVAVSQSSVTARPGTPGAVAVSITSLGTVSGVQLSLVGQPPAGTTAAFSSASISTGQTSSLTFSTTASTATGSYPLKVRGSTATFSHDVDLTLDILAPNDFSLSVAPTSLAVEAGQIGVAQVGIALSGAIANAQLDMVTLPAGVTASFAPNPIASQSTLTLTVAASTVPATYPIVVRGSASTIVRTTTLSLVVDAPPDFSLSASPTSLSTSPGSSAQGVVAIVRSGASLGAVDLDTQGLPAGVTATFAPDPTSGVTSALTLAVGAGVAAGSYLFTIRGTSGSLTRTTPATLVVTPLDFTLTLAPTTLPATPGTTTGATVTMQRSAPAVGAIDLDVIGLPSGTTPTFSDDPATGATSTLSIAVLAGVAAGSYPFTVRGVAAGLTRTVAGVLSVTVAAVGDFSLVASPSFVVFARDESIPTLIVITRTGGHTSPVTLTVPGLPAGVTATFNPNPTVGSAVLSLTASSTAATGTTTVLVEGLSAGIRRSTPFEITVDAVSSGDFGLVLSGTSPIVTAGSSTTATVIVLRSPTYTAPIRFSVSGLPSGVSVSITPSPAPAPPAPLSVLITAGASAVPGNYTFTITGTAAGRTHSVSIPLTVNPPPS